MSLQRFSSRALDARERAWRSGFARELLERGASRRCDREGCGAEAVFALATALTLGTLEPGR
jgi:hypothetical protein